MKIQKVGLFIFKGKPDNYGIIDSSVSRSAQPKQEDFAWLKKQGVTDIINFRTMFVSGNSFNEEDEVRKLGIRYHNIPSYTRNPKEENVNLFLNLVDEITKAGGKIHIHCKAGADRTGLYSFIYKSIKGIGNLIENEKEWIEYGHNTKLYPDLRDWAKNFIKNKLNMII